MHDQHLCHKVKYFPARNLLTLISIQSFVRRIFADFEVVLENVVYWQSGPCFNERIIVRAKCELLNNIEVVDRFY